MITTYTRCLVLSLLAVCPVLLHARLKESAYPVSTVWSWHQDLGFIYSAPDSNWEYQSSLGWVYTIEITPDSFWLFKADTARWYWTMDSVVPAMYDTVDADWYWYDGLEPACGFVSMKSRGFYSVPQPFPSLYYYDSAQNNALNNYVPRSEDDPVVAAKIAEDKANYDAGYRTGYPVGYREGADEGKANGYKKGLKEGTDAGYHAGYEVGYGEAYRYAYDHGNAIGLIIKDGGGIVGGWPIMYVGYNPWNEGYTDGRANGYANAYNPHYNHYYAIGRDEGYKIGYKSGRLEGSAAGYRDGYYAAHGYYPESIPDFQEDEDSVRTGDLLP